MRLYYTVASGYDNPQTKISNSLGGFKSSTPVPNDKFGNLFDELSVLTIKDAKKQYIGLILKNETGAPVYNVQLWFTSPTEIKENEETPVDPCEPKKIGNYASISIAAVKTNLNDKEEPFFEMIPDMYSRPFQAEFFSPTEDGKVTIGGMEDGQEIGIWLCRDIDKAKAIEDYDQVAERDIDTVNRYKPIEKATEEVFELHLTWD